MHSAGAPARRGKEATAGQQGPPTRRGDEVTVINTFHLHLVSDSTGETVSTVSRASLVQFDDVRPLRHLWNMVRTDEQVAEVLEGVHESPGYVLYTLARAESRKRLEAGCRELGVPCVNVLEPVIQSMAAFFGAEVVGRPGRQHVMDAEYFNRIEAIHFVLSHDDGQSARTLNEAEVVLLGVSRTAKTPTCIYLANRGIKAANVPIVPGCPLPPELASASHPLIIGLTKDPRQLVQIRKNRLRVLKQDQVTDYVELDTVTREVNEARRLCAKYGWPVIDTTRKSIEEVAATIMQHLHRRRAAAS